MTKQHGSGKRVGLKNRVAKRGITSGTEEQGGNTNYAVHSSAGPNLLPGDVCLYHGNALISRLIHLFDGTDINHASLYLGDDQVGEAVTNGVVKRDFNVSQKENEWVLIRRLKDTPPMDPVLNRANFYIDQGNRYAYEQIILLAFLSITRKLKITPGLDALVRTILDKAASALTKTLNGKKKQPMICSEFVYRAYDEAIPDDRADVYSLLINGWQLTSKVSGSLPGLYSLAGLPARGSGIHPHSILAFLSSESSRVWAMSGPVSKNLAGHSPASAIPVKLDDLIETYLREIKEDPKSMSISPKRSDLALLRHSVHKFAEALANTHKPKVKTNTMSLSVFSTQSPAFQLLQTTAADFVTPGDLLRTQSLFDVGKISGGELSTNN